MLRFWVPAILGCMVWLALAAESVADGGEEAVKDPAAVARAEALVKQLGDPRFRMRQQAARDLRQIGLPAIEALRNAAKSPYLEVRLRAAQLLEDVERIDLERRLQLFLKKPDEQRDAALPGWERYRKLVGDDRAARELFVEMQRAEPKLFRMLEVGGKELSSQYESRCVELQYARSPGRVQQTALGSVCALLFIGSEPSLTMSEQTAGAIYNFTHQNEFRTALASGPKVGRLRKLLGGWIARPDTVAAYQRTRLAMRHNLREGLVPALEVVNSGGSNYHLQYAVLAIGKLGSRAHVPVLEKLLDNRAVLGKIRVNNQPNSTCEVRDMALAVILHLTGQNPEQYGFKRLRHDSQNLFSANSAGFPNDAEREAAFKKWALWKAANATGTSEAGKSPPAQTEGP